MKTIPLIIYTLSMAKICNGWPNPDSTYSRTIQGLENFLDHEANEVRSISSFKSSTWHNTHIYTISKVNSKEDFDKVKKNIAEETGSKNFVQVIGSSCEFKSNITNNLRSLLCEKLDSQTILVYGVTGDGVNGIINDILQSRGLEIRHLVVGNLVEESFGYMEKIDMKSLPGHLTYLFDSSKEAGTKFGDDNDLADSLSDSYIVVGGGPQTIEQIDIALKARKTVTIMVSEQGMIEYNDRISAGDAIVEVKKRWAHHQSSVGNNHPEKTYSDEAFELLKSLYPDWEENDRLGKLPQYLGKWRASGYLEKINVITVE